MADSNLFSAFLISVLAPAFLIFVAIRIVTKKRWKRTSSLTPPPGPMPFPILGSIHYLGMFDIPFAGFTYLKQFYGNIFSIRLGSSDCVVVNTPELRDEVLVTKAADFDGRPDFERFRLLFGGDKDNSLAFCDFSATQVRRRSLLHPHTLPHSHSTSWERMDAILVEEGLAMREYIEGKLVGDECKMDVKPIILKALANIFNRYFCDSQRFDYEDPGFCAYVSSFDAIFWEVNTGRLCDMAPWALFAAAWPILKSRREAGKVRKFVQQQLVQPRQQRKSNNDPSTVLLDALMPCLEERQPKFMSADKALYALEDVLGGHSAVGCMALRVLWDLAGSPNVQGKIEEELCLIRGQLEPGSCLFTMNHSDQLHWTRASVFETIRLTCSPIVPHMATKDSTVGGFDVKKGTLMFVNNHELSMSKKYWPTGGDTSDFQPIRFLGLGKDESSSGSLVFRRPSHFFPFSLGRRSCMGFKMVENMVPALVLAILENFDVSLTEEGRNWKIPKGLLGLPPRPMELIMRKKQPATTTPQ